MDHLGTQQELTDFSGHIVWSAKYNAYGKVSRLQHGAAEQLEQPLRFQGQYYDSESGLHYNRHRYYNPDVGRYLTPDPIKLAGGLNQYQYTPNPTGWVDPLGLACGPCPGEIEADGPFSVLAPGGGLSAHEARGGHLIRKHIGRTETQLRQRLEDEPWLGKASTFYDQATAEKATYSVIGSKKSDIEKFMKSHDQQIIINDSLPFPVGFVLKRNASTVDVSGVHLLLRKDSRMPDGYRIHTGYAE
ncbi:RHS repeat-associated core domain-containing protein [Rhodococcus sp. IEGM1300]